MRSLLLLAALAAAHACAADLVAVTDGINYNAGSTVQLRIEGSASGPLTASIRYAGEIEPVAHDLKVAGTGAFAPLWKIPWDARTGRYEIDINGRRNATSFAVHRKLARIARVELDRTFYTNGDPIDCRVTIRNLTNKPLDGLRVEFATYHYPWIAPAPDDPKIHASVLADSLALPAGGEKDLKGMRVAIARGGDKPAVTGYAIIIWDKARQHVYDLAFTEPIFLRPPNIEYPKRYPFLYLCPSLDDVAKRALAYRQFYPPKFVSPVIEFDTSHTIFPSGSEPEFKYTIKEVNSSTIRARVFDAAGKLIRTLDDPAKAPALPDGRYIYELSLLDRSGSVIASNRLEFALNPLPKSILVFCAHQDDDTAHPALIRAAVENHIPIHFVYFTSGDAGGCDRYYQKSCDASRAMDFAETRMAETRASLAHLGVPPENVFFLGLPDGGLEEIWLNHLKADRPYLSVLLASDHAPYNGIVKPNLPFAREPIVDVAKEFIRKYQPDVIVTGHPEERHVDHRTNNWLVVKAMQELLRENGISPKTRLLVDKSYGETSWIHSPYKYEEDKLFVPGEVARIGQEALWFYQSQDGNHFQGALTTYDKLPRREAELHFWLLDWDKHEGWNEKPLH